MLFLFWNVPYLKNLYALSLLLNFLTRCLFRAILLGIPLFHSSSHSSIFDLFDEKCLLFEGSLDEFRWWAWSLAFFQDTRFQGIGERQAPVEITTLAQVVLKCADRLCTLELIQW